MIEAPKRAVTHFLVPFIDVTLLMFSLFLLMPMAREEGTANDEVEVADLDPAQLQLQSKFLEDALREARAELAKKEEMLVQLLKDKDVFQALYKLQKESEKLKEEIRRLEKERDAAKQTPNFVRVIDIDADTGRIFYFDPYRLPDPKIPIRDSNSADTLIAKHREEAGERQLYYHFMFPRRDTGYPTRTQENTYKQWFAGVANSLTEKTP